MLSPLCPSVIATDSVCGVTPDDPAAESNHWISPGVPDPVPRPAPNTALNPFWLSGLPKGVVGTGGSKIPPYSRWLSFSTGVLRPPIHTSSQPYWLVMAPQPQTVGTVPTVFLNGPV